MVTAQEIIVSLKSQGAEETNAKLETTQDKMKETANETKRQASVMSDFSSKVTGAMAAIVAGLTVGAAGVLSQVPVVGEAVAGLKSIFDGVVIQLDEELRPGLTKLSDEFFQLGNAIAAGDFEQAKKELGDIANVIGSFGFEDLRNIQDVVANAIGGVVKAIRSVINGISAEDVETFGLKVIDLLKRGLSKFINATDWSQFILDIISFMKEFTKGAKKVVNKGIVQPIINHIEDNWEDWLSDAKDLGKDLIDKLIEGVKNKAGELAETVKNIDLVAGISIADVTDSVSSSNSSSSAGSSSGGGGGLPAGLGVNDLSLNLDGRSLIESTGRHDKDRVTRR